MIAMHSRWLFPWIVFAGATLCTTVNAQSAQPSLSAPTQQDANAPAITTTTTQQDPAPAKAAEPEKLSTPQEVVVPPLGAEPPKKEKLSRALIPPAVIASIGITGFLVNGIIYEYAGGLIADVKTCNGVTCPEDKALLMRARGYRSGTVYGMVASGLLFGVGLIWFAVLAPNANSYTPPQAYVVPVITPNGVFLTGAF
jgi:hypothetical protein